MVAAAQHTITLRILDARTGKPVKRASASIVRWNDDGKVEILSHGTTNSEGLIAFSLLEPLPDRIGFDFSPNELKYCSDLAFSTTEIIKVSVVAQNTCGKVTDKTSVSRSPGEITIFANKVSLWERMRRELL